MRKNILKNLETGICTQNGTYISKNTTIVGDVRLGEDASIWYGSILRGDIERIEVGNRSNIQDGTIIHVSKNKPVIIGNGVSVGHGAKLHGCTIEDNVLIGIGAIVLDGAVIGENTVIAAGSLVAPNKIIPSGSMVMGSPGQVVRKLTDKDIEWVRQNADHYVEYKNIYLEKGY